MTCRLTLLLYIGIGIVYTHAIRMKSSPLLPIMQEDEEEEDVCDQYAKETGATQTLSVHWEQQADQRPAVRDCGRREEAERRWVSGN